MGHYTSKLPRVRQVNILAPRSRAARMNSSLRTEQFASGVSSMITYTKHESMEAKEISLYTLALSMHVIRAHRHQCDSRNREQSAQAK